MSCAVHIGTSGWNYKHWVGPFYPEDLPQKKWLAYYAVYVYFNNDLEGYAVKNALKLRELI